MKGQVKDILVFGLITVLLTSIVGVFPPVEAFSPDVIRTNLSNDSANSQLPEIAVEGNNVYVVWFDDKDILYRKSTDNGANFGSIIDIGDTGGIQASDTFTLSDNGLETDGTDAINLASRSYVFRSSLSIADLNSDNIVLLGSTISETLDNLVAAINLGSGNGTKFVVKSQHADVTAAKASASTMTVTAIIAGTSGDSIVASITDTNNDDEFSVTGPNANTLDNGVDGAVNANPQIIVKDDNVFVTWLDGNDLKFIRSVGGTVFDTEKTLDTVGIDATFDAKPHQRITNSSGSNIYLAWYYEIDDNSGEYRFVNSTDSGDTFPWTPIELGVDDGFAGAFDTQGLDIAAAGSNIYAIYYQANDIQVRRSTDFGDTFLAANTVGTSDLLVTPFPQPTVVADGVNAYAIWKEVASGGSTTIRAVNSSNSGVLFTPDNVVGSNIGTFVNSESVKPKIKVGSGSNVYFAWENNGEIVFHNSTDNGQTVEQEDPTSPTNLSNTGDASDLVDMDTSGNLVHLVWREGPAGNDKDINYKLLVRDAFTSCTAQDLSENAVFSTNPKVASIGNKVYTVWQEHPTSTTTSGGDIIFTAGTVGNACISWGATQYTTSEAAAQITITTAPGTASPISATITSTKTGQSITPSISETGGAGSGIFSTTIAFSESLESDSALKRLKVQRGDTITAQFSGAVGSTKTFSTTISFDSSLYFLSSIPHVTVTDKNIASTDSITVTVTSQKTGKQVQVTLSENGGNTGDFGGTSPTFDHSIVLTNGDQTASVGEARTLRQIDSTTTNTNFKFNQDPGVAENIQLTVRSTTDPTGIPGGLTLIETGANTGTFQASLTLGSSTTATSISVAPCDVLTLINSKGLVSNGFIKTCNDNTKKALEVNVAEGSPDTITASFGGSSVTRTVAFTGGESGGGGGGLVRPGLVVNILAGIQVFGGGTVSAEPRTTLNSLKSDKSYNIPDEVRNVIDNFDKNKPIEPMEGIDFDFPLSINNKGYPVVGFTNTLKTNTLQAGEPVSIKTVQYDNFDLEHITLYMNIRGNQDLFQSDTYITFDNGEVKITDPHGYFKDAGILVTEDREKKKREISFDITFAKEMEKTNFIMRSWNDEKFSSMVNILDAIEVKEAPEEIQENIEAEIQKDLQEPIESIEKNQKDDTLVQNPPQETGQNLIQRDAILDWAGYSQEITSDKEFLDEVGIEGDEVPNWFKNNIGKLIYTEQVSLEEFINALKFMEKMDLI